MINMVERDNTNINQELGFIFDCHYSAAITFEELLMWAYNMIEKCDNLPTYMYYLTDCHNISEVRKEIGLEPIYTASKPESDSLWGIAVKRGINVEEESDGLITNEKALKFLAENPHIEQRIRETFPFINF
jgi:hypothetical protein